MTDHTPPAPVQDPRPLAAPLAGPPVRESATAALPLGRDDSPLVARGLTLRTPRGSVFAPVDLDLPARTPLAVLGTQGSGRSALLLALTGRLQGTEGELRLGGLDAMAHPHRLRRRTAVAHISGLVELEDALTVRDSLEERLLLDGVPRRAGRARFHELCDAVGFDADPRTPVGRLPALQRTVLAALLACLRPARLVAYDDVDASLTALQLDHVHEVLGVLGELGHPFAVSALASAATPPGAVVLHLSPSEEN